jgi:hypothetical protein
VGKIFSNKFASIFAEKQVDAGKSEEKKNLRG